MDSLSIVIPAYNEETRLPASLDAVTQYVRQGCWRFAEIVVVDDGSTDGTARATERYAATHPEVRLLRNPGNRGKGYAVRHGMLDARGDWILFTDADLSAPIEEACKLFQAVRERHAQLAFGSRGLDRSLIEVHQSWFRETAGRLFNLFVRLLAGLPYADTQCGFKLFQRQAAREIFRRQRLDRFGFDVEVLYVAKRLGFRAVEVPVRWRHSEGTKVRVWRDGLSMFLDLLRIRWNDLRGRYR
ncbi:MAG: glycosyltransferase family 2 protein [Bryobacterales bacterium]|nr:glycosyltransferase family 2 protein [Bryobacteraceae bacterium]MDW8355877.1 glycosyltransferase family 2 protein [Bryobacterales bacterium]